MNNDNTVIQAKIAKLNQQLLLLVSLCSPFFLLLALAIQQYFSDSAPLLPIFADQALLKICIFAGIALILFESVCMVKIVLQRAQLQQQLKKH